MCDHIKFRYVSHFHLPSNHPLTELRHQRISVIYIYIINNKVFYKHIMLNNLLVTWVSQITGRHKNDTTTITSCTYKHTRPSTSSLIRSQLYLHIHHTCLSYVPIPLQHDLYTSVYTVIHRCTNICAS